MSEVLEAGLADDTPPTPFTMRYADSPHPILEAEHPQHRPADTDPFYWGGVVRQQQQQLQQQQPKPQQCEVARWQCRGTAATAHFQRLREDCTRHGNASQHCSADPTGPPACVEFRPVHLLTATAALSRESSGAPTCSSASSCSGFGGQSTQIPSIAHPPGCAVFHAKVQRLHHCAHQAAAPSWPPPTHGNYSTTPPPPWAQPKLSATLRKVALATQQQPVGRRLSVGTLLSPAGCAGLPYHALPPGQSNNLQVHTRQRMDAWPVAPATAAEIRSWQASGSAAFFGKGIPSRAGRRSLGQEQGQPHVPAGGVDMAPPQKGIASKAELLEAIPVPIVSGATQLMEAPCDNVVRGRVAALCTPALSTRRVRSVCSPCLCSLEGSLLSRAESAPE